MQSNIKYLDDWHIETFFYILFIASAKITGNQMQKHIKSHNNYRKTKLHKTPLKNLHHMQQDGIN